VKLVRIAWIGVGGVVLAAALLAPRAAHAVAAALVQVVNTSSAPAVTSSIDTPGRIPYQATASVDPACLDTSSCTAVFPAVPPNHRLVVQQASGYLIGSTGTANYFLGPGPIPGNNTIVVFSAGIPFATPVLAYFDAGQQPGIQAISNTPSFSGLGYFTLTGYMLDCSATSCAAIAQ